PVPPRTRGGRERRRGQQRARAAPARRVEPFAAAVRGMAQASRTMALLPQVRCRACVVAGAGGGVGGDLAAVSAGGAAAVGEGLRTRRWSRSVHCVGGPSRERTSGGAVHASALEGAPAGSGPD